MATTRVGVTVLTDIGDGRPDLSATVVFAGADNELILQGLVGAEGHAEAEMPEGGTVHVLRVVEDGPDQQTVRIVSLLQVAPGDEIVFGAAAGPPSEESITIGGFYEPAAGATDHFFDHPCGIGFAGVSQFVTLDSFVGCPTMFEALGTATSFSDPTFVPKYAWFTVAELGDFTVPAMQDMASFTATLTNIATPEPLMLLERVTLLPPYFTFPAAPVGALGPEDVNVQLYYPPSDSALGLVKATFGAIGGPQQVLSTRIPGAAASIDLDVAGLPLPAITTEPVLAGRVVTWSQEGTGDPDARQVQASSTHTAGGVAYAVTWTVIDGSTEDSLELPGLPEMFADLDPTQQLASQPVRASVEYVDYSNVQGYDAARHLPLESLFAREQVFCRTCGLFGDEVHGKRMSASFAYR